MSCRRRFKGRRECAERSVECSEQVESRSRMCCHPRCQRQRPRADETSVHALAACWSRSSPLSKYQQRSEHRGAAEREAVERGRRDCRGRHRVNATHARGLASCGTRVGAGDGRSRQAPARRGCQVDRGLPPGGNRTNTIPKNKLLPARDVIGRKLQEGITFGEYRALVGLLEHLRFVSRRKADTANALYIPDRKGGTKGGPSS